MREKLRQSLVWKDLLRRPGRTVGLGLLTALLAFSLLCGTVVVSSLRKGLSSLNDRLGADIMVVPYEATTKTNLANLLLQGSTGYFYMDKSKLDQIASTPGVGQVSAQFYLASTSSGCCSLPVQIIGIDPGTDFTIAPWLKKSGGTELEDGEVYVGNDLNAFVGDTLTFYGEDVRVAGKLDRTGTSLDTAVYTNEATVKSLIRSSLELKMNDFSDIDPERVVSCVLVNVAEGYSVEEVLYDLKLHVRKTEAIRTKDMISGVSQSLEGVSRVIGILVGVVWVLGLLVLSLAFAVLLNERRKEFAVLRALGASQRKVSRILLGEGLLTSLFGGAIGVLLSCLIVLPFQGFLEGELSLPFLLPKPPAVLLTALLSLALSCLAGALSSLAATRRILQKPAAELLREGE